MSSADGKQPTEQREQGEATKAHTGCSSCNGKTPFVYRFATEQGKYIYDASTKCILPVEEVAWEIIEDVGALTRDEVVAKYAGRFAAEQIAQAHACILERQREGYFLAKRPQVELTLSEEEVRNRLLTKREILILNVTERCNFRCRYCTSDGHHEGRPGHSEKEMAWSVARQAMDEFLPHAVDEPSLTFYGGEPLLHLDLMKECVAYARRKCGDRKLHLGLTTNGSLLTGATADFLVAEGFSISISLDGPREIHDRYRRTADDRPTWDRVTQNIREFRARHPEYGLRMLLVVTLAPPLNLEVLDTFFRTTDVLPESMYVQVSLADLRGVPESAVGPGEIHGFDRIYRQYLESLSRGEINRNGQDRRHVLARRLFEQGFLRFHKRFQFGELTPPRRHFADTYCALATCVPGVRRTFVSTEGDYWPCERVPQSEYLRIGRVPEGLDVPKIHRTLREWIDMTKDQCPTCWCLRGCNLGCFATFREGDRPTREQKQEACQRHRLDQHRLLVDYCRVLEKDPTNFAYMNQIWMG